MGPGRRPPSDPTRQSTQPEALAAVGAYPPSLPATVPPSQASNSCVLKACSDGNLGSSPELPARPSWRAGSTRDLCSGADCQRASSGRCWRDRGSRTAVTGAAGDFPGRTGPWNQDWELSGVQRRRCLEWRHGESNVRCSVGVFGLVRCLTERTQEMRESRDRSGPCENPVRKETRCASPI